jgi:hypothetical protein
MDLDMEKRVTTGAEATSPLPNATFAALELQYRQNVSEGWYGLTWARALGSRLGIGVTPELAVRSQHTTASLFAMGENASGQQAVLRTSRDFELLHWRLLARMGINGVRDSLTYGLTLTTPGVGLFGSAAYRQSVNLTDQSGTVGNVIGASYQDELKSHYRSPLGLGAGASYRWGSLRVHVAAEWWAAVDRYTLIEGEPFTVQTPIGDSTITPRVEEELSEVVNVGIGLERYFSPDLAGYLSYHTDRSAHSADSAPGASVTAWDLNHVAGGVTFNAWRSNFALGGSAAFGNRPIQASEARPDRVPPADLQSQALILTATFGWKISF